jgi:hypothetical protein
MTPMRVADAVAIAAAILAVLVLAWFVASEVYRPLS